MIYDIYWSQTQPTVVTSWNKVHYPGKNIGDQVGLRPTLAEFVRSSKDDTFIFVLVAGGLWKQTESFDKWLEEEKLGDLVVARSGGITNPIHANNKHNLHVVIMQSKEHFQREESKNVVA